MHSCGFVKGLIAGAAIGAMMGMIFDPVSDRDRRYMKKRVNRMMRNAGNIIDSMHM